MTKKDFFVITESDNLYLDLAPCSGYVVFDTIGIYKNPHNDFAFSREQRKNKDAKRWNAIYKKLLDERAQ